MVPDAVAAAFLDAIAADPEGVAKALAKSRAEREAAERITPAGSVLERGADEAREQRVRLQGPALEW